MPTIQTADGIRLHYTDTGGEGRPLVLVHGWPLSGQAFARNAEAFSRAGYRAIAYDRRGFGRSDKPGEGYDYDVLSDDLAALMDGLDLADAVILGFSMGGGEVARYLARHGSGRVSGAIFSGAITPALCLTEDNPDGAMPIEGFQAIANQLAADHNGFLDQFVGWFYSTEADGLRVDEATRREALTLARQAAPHAALASIFAWATDLRQDCLAIDVPTLVLHGDGDLNVPLAASSARMAEFVPDSRLVVIEGGPHGVNASHPKEWEGAILEFLGSLD